MTQEREGRPDPVAYTDLRGVARTAFVTVAARAWDAQSSNPILGDARAPSLLEALKRNGHDLSNAQMGPTECQSIAIRTRHFDRWTSDFVQKHEDPLIVHLGCGLDSRAERIEWSPSASWVDIDLPEVISLRKELVHMVFADREYRLLAADITQSDWLQSLPKDKPTAIVMEAVMSYLNEHDVRKLVSTLTAYFDKGQIFFDCISSTILNATRRGKVKSIKDIKADLASAIDDLDDWKARIDQPVDLLEVIRFVEVDGVQFLPLITRLQMYMLSWVPGLRDSARLVRLGFGRM